MGGDGAGFLACLFGATDIGEPAPTELIGWDRAFFVLTVLAGAIIPWRAGTLTNFSVFVVELFVVVAANFDAQDDDLYYRLLEQIPV
ncbi:MAG: hypothetical protein RLZZ338_152 [Cyanobacteriota bacterium]